MRAIKASPRPRAAPVLPGRSLASYPGRQCNYHSVACFVTVLDESTKLSTAASLPWRLGHRVLYPEASWPIWGGGARLALHQPMPTDRLGPWPRLARGETLTKSELLHSPLSQDHSILGTRLQGPNRSTLGQAVAVANRWPWPTGPHQHIRQKPTHMSACRLRHTVFTLARSWHVGRVGPSRLGSGVA